MAPVSEEERRRFCDYFYRETGMSFVENKPYYVDKRLEERMAATRTGDFASSFALLRGGGEEVQRLISLFTVNETYFYREEYQFTCLTADLLPSLLASRAGGARPGRPIRLWSVPCSTGEEPYSLAIWLLENFAEVDEHEVEIVGSDIDADALATAAAGVFGARALQRMPPALIDRYFVRVAEGAWQIIAGLRRSIALTRVNLVDRAGLAGHRGYDVVFCRNLLIYFDETSRRVAAENLYEALAPGGYLCMGHSESMSRISPLFLVRRFRDAIVYQKPVAHDERGVLRQSGA
jgi:chemotaxis protein methyltransferase CheR